MSETRTETSISYEPTQVFFVLYRWQGERYQALQTPDYQTARKKLKQLRADKWEAWIE